MRKHLAARVFASVLFLALFCCCLPAAAQVSSRPDFDISKISNDPITEVDLGVSSLTLEPGESYHFDVSYVPEFPAYTALSWFITDESILSVDPASFTVTALAPGQARILAESFDGVSFAVCDVTVSGKQPKAAAALRTGAERISLAAADRAKIASKPFTRVLDFILKSPFSEEAFKQAMQRPFGLIAEVTPGTEEAQSQKALALGMRGADPLLELNEVALHGTLDQILRFAAGNPDLIRLIGGEKYILHQPLPQDFSSESVQKAVDLGTNVEALTAISTAHSLGIDGSGTTIAIIDTGLDSSHEQFNGRVIYEACFSNYWYSGPVCKDGQQSVTGKGAAAPSAARTKSNFNHGSHVAGIAAGRDGIAPKANIVAIQAFSEMSWECTADDLLYESYGIKHKCDDYDSTGECCGSYTVRSQAEQGIDYLLSLQKTIQKAGYPKISALNLAVDEENNGFFYYMADRFDKLSQAGIVTAVGSGNNSADGSILRGMWDTDLVYPVGALADEPTPYIAGFSDHSEKVAITAPGVNIHSATYVYEPSLPDIYRGTCADGVNGTKNCYANYDGTDIAAPMVTGAIALMNQAFPLRTADEYRTILKSISPVTVDYRLAGENPAKTFPYKTKVLNFSKTANYLHIANRWVVGYSSGILVKIPVSRINSQSPAYTVTATDMSSKKVIFKNKTVTPTLDSTGKYWKLAVEDPQMVQGTVYKLQITQTAPYKTNTVSKYGTPMRSVSGPTAAPTNGSVTVNTKPVPYSDGTRYIIRETNGSLVASKYLSGTEETVWTASGLSNGKVYHLIVNPYIRYNSLYLWGPTVFNIYFMPLGGPNNPKLTWTNSSSGKVTISPDTAVSGMRVLYREADGKVKNGCEAAGTSCTVKGLDQSASYEFYVMKYKDSPSGKRHYGPGVVINHNVSVSELPAPASPVIQQSGSKFTVTIEKDSEAEGISVVFRRNTEKFQLLCEKAGNSCSRTISTPAAGNYFTFFVMQYRLENGRKIYSPGTIAKNLLSPKSADFSGDETVDPDEIRNALPDYLSEEDAFTAAVLMHLAEEGSAEGFISKDADPFSAAYEIGDEIELAGDFDIIEGPDAVESPDWASFDSTDNPESITVPASGPNTIEFYRLDEEDRQQDPNIPSFR